MVQVELLGPRGLLEEALAFLQAQGVLQLRSPDHGSAAAPLAEPLPPSAAETRHREALAGGLRRIEELLARLPPDEEASAAAAPALALPAPADPGLVAELDGLSARLDALEARRAALLDERDRTEAFSRLVVALAPLGHGLDPSLEPELHALVLHRDPVALALLEAEVRRITGGNCELKSRDLDGGQVGVLMAVPRACGRELAALLYERGVEEVRRPPATAGRGLVDGLVAVAVRERELPAEVAAAAAELARFGAAARPALAAAAAAAAGELDRLAASARCGATRFAFVVAGWMAAERLPALREAVAIRFGDRVELQAREPPPSRWAEVPVVLRNPPAIRPFERLLGLVSLPRYGSTDPTPWLAVGFPLFFGLVLGDLAFGLVGVAGALLARARGWGGPLGRDVAAVALACSASAALFGLLFGELLGGLGARFGLHPLLFERRDGLMALLALAVGLGLLHLLAGAGLGVANALRAGRWRQAVARTGQLIALAGAAAAVAALLGPLPPAVLLPALAAGGAGLLAAMAAEGPMALLELVLTSGHVLSYARLMALGLASAMLAEVANQLAGLRPAAAGLALAILLHTVNFTLCLASPIVAALRLHLVEFFERFYDEGGEPFVPFASTHPR
jgi:V/A-type H+-transporting ATPase subunit I